MHYSRVTGCLNKKAWGWLWQLLRWKPHFCKTGEIQKHLFVACYSNSAAQTKYIIMFVSMFLSSEVKYLGKCNMYFQYTSLFTGCSWTHNCLKIFESSWCFSDIVRCQVGTVRCPNGRRITKIVRCPSIVCKGRPGAGNKILHCGKCNTTWFFTICKISEKLMLPFSFYVASQGIYLTPLVHVHNAV